MSHHWGYIAALSSALLFGISATLNKIVLGKIHPLVVAGAIYFLAGVVLMMVRFTPLHTRIISVTKSIPTWEGKIGVRDFGTLLLVILSGAVVAPFLYLHGLNETTAVNASLLANTESLFTILIAFVFLGERARKREYFAMSLLVLGAVIVTTNLEFQLLTITEQAFGNMLIIASCLFWGIDNNLSKLLSVHGDLVQISAIKSLIGGGIVLCIVIALAVPFNITISLLPYLIIIGTFSIGISLLLFLFALREIGAMKTAVIFSISSLFGAAFAFLVLSEPVSVVQGVAGLLMITGVYLLSKKRVD